MSTNINSRFTVTPLVVPTSIHSPDAADFIGFAVVKSLVEAELRGGSSELASTPEAIADELLPSWRDESTRMSGLIAAVDGHVVARGSLALPSGAVECWIAVSVLPGHRGRGIGTALYEQLERQAVDAGRTVVQNQTSFAPGLDGETLPGPGGFGAVPLELASTRFLVSQGFSLGQVGRMSALALPLDPEELRARLDSAAASASDYRTVTWFGRTPPEWLDGMALLRTRMSTDTPNAGMEQSEDVWTAERVTAFDDLFEASPRVVVTTIAVHRETEDVAGYTELDVPAEPDRPVEQMDTLVLRDHRGHRIGMLLKLVNIRALGERFPDRTAIESMNAEENRPMLDVNEELGFEAVSFAARWRKDVGQPSA